MREVVCPGAETVAGEPQAVPLYDPPVEVGPAEPGDERVVRRVAVVVARHREHGEGVLADRLVHRAVVHAVEAKVASRQDELDASCQRGRAELARGADIGVDVAQAEDSHGSPFRKKETLPLEPDRPGRLALHADLGREHADELAEVARTPDRANAPGDRREVTWREVGQLPHGREHRRLPSGLEGLGEEGAEEPRH